MDYAQTGMLEDWNSGMPGKESEPYHYSNKTNYIYLKKNEVGR